MQLTRFDRWLRQKFAYETQIHTLRPPTRVPRGVRAKLLPDHPGNRYRHQFFIRNPKLADRFVSQLKEDNQMYTIQVVDRNSWYVPFIAPSRRSVSWSVFSLMVFSTAAFFVLTWVKGLVDDPEFRRNFMESIEILKG